MDDRISTAAKPVTGPDHPSLRSALPLALLFAAAKLLVHIVANLFAGRAGYGIFRDELYYIVCGRNLDWGYLDQPPLVALQARLAETLFGLHSLALFRLLPSLAGAAAVALAGLLAALLGGRRTAQALAMLGVLCSPILLGVDGNLSMNAWEPVLWLSIALCLAAVLRRSVSGQPVAALWAAIGILAGLGLENKWNIAFFLLSMFVGVLLSPQRRILANRWVLVGTVLALLLAAPNFLWEMHRGWPTLEWLHNDATGDKNLHLAPLAFVANQVQVQNPASLLLWGGGLLWLLFASPGRLFRSFGLMFLVYLPAMIAMHAKDYYLAPVFPILFAAGGVALSQVLRLRWQRRILIPLYAVVLLLLAALALPLALPVLRPETYVAYTRWIGRKTPETQTFDHAALPQYFADMRGWRQKANALADAYWALPPGDRSHAVIYTTNYGGASAVNVFRPDVPVAVSGHQNYWFWGPRGHNGDIMIIYGDSRATDEREFASVTDVPWTPDPWTEPYEQKPIYVCRSPRGWTLPTLWPKVKVWY